MSPLRITPRVLLERFAFTDLAISGARTALRMRVGPASQHADFTFRDLHREAAAVAATMRARGVRKGELVALLLPHSRALIAHFFGAIYAGIIPAIIAWPTTRMDPDKYRRNVSAVVQGLDADWLVTEPSTAEALGSVLGRARIFDVGATPIEGVSLRPEVQPDGSLFVQFSGGTTGTQKSVVITAAHLAAQLDAYAQVLQPTPDDGVVSWLPLYHDMGLIACLVMPFLLRIPVTIFSPMEWVMDPRPFLESIGHDRTTLAWLPNFAFAFLAKKTRGAVSDLDLSSLRAVINCSEPVRDESMNAFAERFRDAGLSPQAIHTCYAMAEATFAVTQTTPGDPPRRLRVDEEALRRGRLVASDAGARTLVSCGRVIPTLEARVVGEAQDLPTGGVGEIWLRGESIMDDYMGSLDRAAFTDGWYRTGDLGAVVDGHVFVVGRKKDLIIVGGINVFPEDIEAAVSRVPGVHAGRAVAMGVYSAERGTEQIVVVAEASSEQTLATHESLGSTVRRVALEASGVAPHRVFIVPPQWIVKSTAGKLARGETRERVLLRWASLEAGTETRS